MFELHYKNIHFLPLLICLVVYYIVLSNSFFLAPLNGLCFCIYKLIIKIINCIFNNNVRDSFVSRSIEKKQQHNWKLRFRVSRDFLVSGAPRKMKMLLNRGLIYYAIKKSFEFVTSNRIWRLTR